MTNYSVHMVDAGQTSSSLAQSPFQDIATYLTVCRFRLLVCDALNDHEKDALEEYFEGWILTVCVALGLQIHL